MAMNDIVHYDFDAPVPWWKLRMTHFSEFDESPGEDVIGKAVMWGKRGLLYGSISGMFHAAIDRHGATGGAKLAARRIITHAGLATAGGAVLAAGITIGQATMGRNDGWPWAFGGYAAGFVFGLPGRRFGVGFKFAALGATTMAALKLCGDYHDEHHTQPHKDSLHPEKHTLNPILRI